MPVTMICPNLKCGRTVIASEAARGRVVRCAHCQQLFMVPLNAASPDAVEAPAPDSAKLPAKVKKK